MAVRHPSGFIAPCLPSKVVRPPSGSLWLHEIKFDGYRLMVRRDARPRVRCFTRNGYDWAHRSPAIVAAANRIKASTFLIDGEVVIVRKSYSLNISTHMLSSGVHPEVASERLGHSKVGITLDLYSHVLPGMQEDAVAKVDAALLTPLALTAGRKSNNAYMPPSVICSRDYISDAENVRSDRLPLFEVSMPL